MWPLAECISSILVQTPSLQLGVLQSLHSSFLLRPILLSHLALSYLWWKPGQRCTSPSLFTTGPKSGIREWTPLHKSYATYSMSILNAGHVYLTSKAVLGKPHSMIPDPLTVLYDGYVICKGTTHRGTKIRTWFHYKVRGFPPPPPLSGDIQR